ncbi:MAG: hypothetical protein AAGH42_00140 [Pseudomonadota bacterium]
MMRVRIRKVAIFVLLAWVLFIPVTQAQENDIYAEDYTFEESYNTIKALIDNDEIARLVVDRDYERALIDTKNGDKIRAHGYWNSGKLDRLADRGVDVRVLWYIPSRRPTMKQEPETWIERGKEVFTAYIDFVQFVIFFLFIAIALFFLQLSQNAHYRRHEASTEEFFARLEKVLSRSRE